MFTEAAFTYAGLMAMLLAIIFYITSTASDSWRTKRIRESATRIIIILVASLVMFTGFACAFLHIAYALGVSFFGAAGAIASGAIDVVRFPQDTIGRT